MGIADMDFASYWFLAEAASPGGAVRLRWLSEAFEEAFEHDGCGNLTIGRFGYHQRVG